MITQWEFEALFPLVERLAASAFVARRQSTAEVLTDIGQERCDWAHKVISGKEEGTAKKSTWRGGWG